MISKTLKEKLIAPLKKPEALDAIGEILALYLEEFGQTDQAVECRRFFGELSESIRSKDDTEG